MVNLNSSAANAFLHKVASAGMALYGLLPSVLASLASTSIVIPHDGKDWAAFGLGLLGLFAHGKDAATKE